MGQSRHAGAKAGENAPKQEVQYYALFFTVQKITVGKRMIWNTT
jgi:hypothetical protein